MQSLAPTHETRRDPQVPFVLSEQNQATISVGRNEGETMESGQFVIPNVQIENPQQTLEEIQDICRPYSQCAMYEPCAKGHYNIIVSRPVPLDLGAQLASHLGIRGLLSYWPGPVEKLRLIIRDQKFERVLHAVNDAVQTKFVNLIGFDPHVQKQDDGTVEVTLEAQNDAARHDTLTFYLRRHGILNPDADVEWN